jgi:hypothetical protein
MTARTLYTGSLLFSLVTLSPQLSQAQTIKADHSTVDVHAIPATSVSAAQALRMSFSHASVGGNIWSGLQTLASDSTYAFPNWKDNNRGNPGWEEKITQFESWVADHASQFDVFQNKFCYIDQDADFATYRDSMLELMATYPTKAIVWWTMPIMTDGADNAKRQSFNQQVRAYCAANDCPLFDIADIESHKTDGTAVMNGGVEALDPDQSSDGGHLTDLGASRAAKAQWALMAQIAGWHSNSSAATGGAGSISAGDTGGGSSADSGAHASGGCSIAHLRKSSQSVGTLVFLFGLVLAARRRVRDHQT